MDGWLLAVVAMASALISAGLIAVMLRYLRIHVLAHPNARSSHQRATPQGGGAGVVLATFAVAWAAVTVSDAGLGSFGIIDLHQLLSLTVGAALLAAFGTVDDIRGIGPVPRLVAQVIAVGLLIATLPGDARLLPMLPWWIEAAGLLVAGVWVVNLTNFMDGIDWITVAEIVPITGAIALVGAVGLVPPLITIVALALFGAMVGFAPFNKPVASLFLGDVGSQPIGLVLAWLSLQLALHGHVAAALLLPLYYLADATVTLSLRASRREAVWQAHRTHFYQRATDGGFTVTEIVTRVFAVNIALAMLAFLSIAIPHPILSWLLLAAGVALVAWLLAQFAKGKA